MIISLYSLCYCVYALLSPRLVTKVMILSLYFDITFIVHIHVQMLSIMCIISSLGISCLIALFYSVMLTCTRNFFDFLYYFVDKPITEVSLCLIYCKIYSIPQ